MTIGTFDGVHAGHAALLRRARRLADTSPGATPRVVAMCFDPHPLTRLRPGSAPARLTTFERRAELLAGPGADSGVPERWADEVVRLEPTASLLGLSPARFVELVVADFGPLAVVEGEDFRFGRGREGDIATLAELGRRHGFGVEVVPPVEVELADQTLVRASSTMARWLLENGRVRDAAAVLGRPYEADGVVEPGDRRGRTLGFPTANVRTECMIPGDGVYAGAARLADGRRFAAAISVGSKPQFKGSLRTLEAHLLEEVMTSTSDGEAGRRKSQPAEMPPKRAADGKIDGLPEYGWAIRLEFVAWLRDQMRFESVDALVEQIGRDCARAGDVVRWSQLTDSARMTPAAAPIEESARP